MSRVLLNRSVKAIETSPSVRSGSISRCFLVNPVDLFGWAALSTASCGSGSAFAPYTPPDVVP